MIKRIKDLIAWGKTLLSEQDGQGSSSRVIALLCTVSALAAFWYAVLGTHGLPTNDQMTGLGILLGAGHLPYVANQVGSMAGNPSAPASMVAPERHPQD